MTQRYIVQQDNVVDDIFQIIDTQGSLGFAICDNSFDQTKTKAAADHVANALNFTDQWRTLLQSKIKGCERHQRERPDRAAALDNTHRVLTELLNEAGEEWEEQRPK